MGYSGAPDFLQKSVNFLQLIYPKVILYPSFFNSKAAETNLGANFIQ